MAALQYVHVPDYAALLLRRSYQDLSLPDALIPRAQEWLAGTDARWDGQLHQWRFLSGAVVQFGYLDTPEDQYRYQSSAYQFVGFDELTQFAEAQYRYLFSRLRALEGSSVPLRMRGATNPGGRGHHWVRRRLVDSRSRVDGAAYVPARCSDNPHLRADYAASLEHLDPVTRARYRDGDWDIAEDSLLVYPEWDPYEMCGEPPKDTPIRLCVVGADPGLSDPYAVEVMLLDWDDHWWIVDEHYRMGGSTHRWAGEFKALQAKHKPRAWFVDKRRPSDVMDLCAIGLPAMANLEIHSETERGTIKPMIGVVRRLIRERRLTVSRRCTALLQEFEEYQYPERDERNTGEVPLDAHNHAQDAIRYALCSVIEGGIPGVKLWYNRGEKEARPKRPGELPKIPTRDEMIAAQDAREPSPFAQSDRDEWNPVR